MKKAATRRTIAFLALALLLFLLLAANLMTGSVRISPAEILFALQGGGASEAGSEVGGAAGPAATSWAIVRNLRLPRLLAACRDLLEPEGPCRVELSCHSPGFTPRVLERLLRQHFGTGRIEAGEMSIPESTGRELPAGVTAGWSRK